MNPRALDDLPSRFPPCPTRRRIVAGTSPILLFLVAASKTRGKSLIGKIFQTRAENRCEVCDRGKVAHALASEQC